MPLAARTAFGLGVKRCTSNADALSRRMGCTTKLRLHTRVSPGCFLRTEGSSIALINLIHRDTFGCASTFSAQLRPLGFCRPLLQSATTFAAPFFIRPDPEEDDIF
jgi:hypothetical protein